MILLAALGLFLFSADTIELIEISAAWCIPCRQQAPVMRRLESEGIRVHHVDFDKQRNIADAWRVESVPTTIVLRGGREVRRFVGLTSYETFQATLKQFSTPAVPSRPVPQPRRPQGSGYDRVIRWWMAATSQPATVGSTPPFGLAFADAPGIAAPVEQQAVVDVPALALACHIRIKVDEGSLEAWGSGTIVNYGKGKTDIVTNKHVVGGSGGTIAIDDGTNYWKGVRCVEVWPKGPRTLADDIAFIVADKLPPASAALCDEGYDPVQPVYMVGSPGGKLPQVRRATILRRWTSQDGGHHLSLSQHTTNGDSGGGVYDSTGVLVGVIWGDDPYGDGGLAVDLAQTSTIGKNTRDKSKSRASAQ